MLLVAGLAVYLFWAGSLLNRIATNLEESFGTAAEILGHAKLIGPGVEHINRTGGVVAGALPLLYGMAEEIVTDVTRGSRAASGDARAGQAGLRPPALRGCSTPSASPPIARRQGFGLGYARATRMPAFRLTTGSPLVFLPVHL